MRYIRANIGVRAYIIMLWFWKMRDGTNSKRWGWGERLLNRIQYHSFAHVFFWHDFFHATKMHEVNFVFFAIKKPRFHPTPSRVCKLKVPARKHANTIQRNGSNSKVLQKPHVKGPNSKCCSIMQEGTAKQIPNSLKQFLTNLSRWKLQIGFVHIDSSWGYNSTSSLQYHICVLETMGQTDSFVFMVGFGNPKLISCH